MHIHAQPAHQPRMCTPIATHSRSSSTDDDDEAGVSPSPNPHFVSLPAPEHILESYSFVCVEEARITEEEH
jgi:hypothetical protein